jgi:hypothetical protein
MSNSKIQRKRKTEPRVGLFWLFNDELIIDGTPLDQAEARGEFRNDPRGHEELWNEYQRINRVPRELEYDEVPRGRVLCQAAIPPKFVLYADLCILRRQDLVLKILDSLGLPSGTTVSADQHYHCPHCMLKHA